MGGDGGGFLFRELLERGGFGLIELAGLGELGGRRPAAISSSNNRLRRNI